MQKSFLSISQDNSIQQESRPTQFSKELIILYLNRLLFLLHGRMYNAVPCTLQGEEKKTLFRIIEQICIRRTSLNQAWAKYLIKMAQGRSGHRTSHRAQGQQNHFSLLWPWHIPWHQHRHSCYLSFSLPEASEWLPPKPQQASFLSEFKIAAEFMS